jgi:hypothetical protein
MEKTFKFVFFLAILAFCVLIIGVFLLVLKAMLLINPEIHMFGLTIV